MLNSISWEHFLTTIIIVVGGYYVIATLLLFSDEIKSFFYQRKTKLLVDGQAEIQNNSRDNKSYVGKTRLATSVGIPKEEDIDAHFVVAESVSVSDEEPIDIITQASILARAAEDLCIEVLSLVNELKPTTVEEAELVMRPLLNRYAFLFQSEHRQAIHEFIIKKVYEASRLKLSETDVNNLWKGEDQSRQNEE